VNERLGLAGTLARRFLDSELTLLIALTGLLLGLLAIVITPREEEPQIAVTFANVFIAYPGASAAEIESLISTPAEQVLSEIEGVEHIYSVSEPGRAVLTVQFKVGQDRTRAIVRLYNAIYSNQDWLPANLGVGQPLIKPKGIDDVPIVTLTLWSKDAAVGGHELQRVAHAIEAELKRVPGTRNIYTVGGPDRVMHVVLDPVRLAGFGIALEDLRKALRAANSSLIAGAAVKDDQEIQIQAGEFLADSGEIARLVVGMHNGGPVYLSDVAQVSRGPDQPEQYVRHGTGPASGKGARGEFPAVTVAIAKQPGTNAVTIANQVIQHFEQLRGSFVPEGVEATVTRNYGATANEKAEHLITKLIFATASVVLLVLIALGWREAVIVGVAVIVTLALTLFASWAWGFTINRVSLFALIFSIGILVDDAIVVVENIHRHRLVNGLSLSEAIPRAVDEVGGPTILATFTVIAALLPMAFVSGLMGPYMSPIPINASMGMLISLAVAFIITPWLSLKLLRQAHGHAAADVISESRLTGLFTKLIGPFLQAPLRRWLLWLAIAVLILISMGLAGVKLVVLKMLPFDNKSEFQIVVDMPEGVAVEKTARVLSELGAYLSTVPEVTDYQIYAGTAAPINFNGLVRQYYLRRGAHVGDIQVNLAEKSRRTRSSHAIALAVRAPLQEIGHRLGANIKIVEVPPGPPVLAPLIAEIYGLDHAGQIATARKVTETFASTPDVVDVDNSIEAAAPKRLFSVDRERAVLFGVSQETVVKALATALGGEDVSYLHDAKAKYAIPIRLEFSVADKADEQALLNLRVPTAQGGLVPLSDFTTIVESRREQTIYHKDLLPVVYVTGDMAGTLDSPLYAMFEIAAKLSKQTLEQFYFRAPGNSYQYSLKWDGEWQITYETFRDMGIAYGVGMILIYLLVVAQFRSYLTPLIIMAPIPLTLIGVMPGHALLGAQFTATSMIGMIALAGIMVRNSILLVDFIEQQLRAGTPLEQAVVHAAATRAKPIVLTGLAAMLGALFILDDPIFNGLAIALVFGVLVSTLLTLVVIPVLYYAVRRRRAVR